MDFSLLELDSKTISKLEQIRFDVFGIKGLNSLETYYASMMTNGKCIVYGAFYNRELVGACYVSSTYNSLYIEQLFIMKGLQRCGLRLGSSLLHYVLSQKEYIEEYFGREFSFSYLEDVTKDSQLYENMGYTKAGGIMKRKRLFN